MGAGRREKKKLAVLLDKAISATTGPTGSPTEALSHPICPQQTCRALPTCPHQEVPLRNDHSTQTWAFWGQRKRHPSCVGPLMGAEASLRMLSLVPEMLMSTWMLLLCLFSVLKLRQPGSATACGYFLFPWEKNVSMEGRWCLFNSTSTKLALAALPALVGLVSNVNKMTYHLGSLTYMGRGQEWLEVLWSP